MKGVGTLRLASMIGAAISGMGEQIADAKAAFSLADAFRPRFSLGERTRGTYRGAGPRHSTSPWSHKSEDRGTRFYATQAKEAAKRVARFQAGDDREWRKRKAWRERNAHVIAKREEQQRNASGRNATIWGRK